MAAMHVQQLYLRDSASAPVVRQCSGRLLEALGPMLAVAWPELESWLDEIVPELAADQPPQPFPEYELTARETKRLLTPEFDTIYPVSNEVLLARLLLAAMRHSELSIVLVPQHVSRGHLVSLLRLCSLMTLSTADLEKPLRAQWLLDVGSYDVDEKTVRLFTDREELLTELTFLLAPLCLADAPLPKDRSP